MSRSALVTIALLAAACDPARTIGSPDVITRPPIAASSPEEAFGRQVQIDARGDVRFYGELVDCDDTFAYLHVNQEGDRAWMMVPWQDVTGATVRLGGPATAVFTTWAALGTVSTISHGFFAILSAPAWLGVGIPSVFWARERQDVSGKCDQIRPYARYPQGMPPMIRERYWGPMPIRIRTAPSALPFVPVTPPGATPPPVMPPGPPVTPPGAPPIAPR